ncbi:MAG TPA: class IV adenylate cyclase [Methanotrichaceae archaeon]|nr:class IV adenylate cyclase [Methanotrichaceae archaeon]
MIEVEVKARANEQTLQRIKALGAVFLKEENHIDIYFNSPLRDFRKTDEALRIRVKEEGARLTYKGPKLDSETKSRQELTVEIDSPERMTEVLRALGFVPSAEVRKRRTKYSLDDVTFALDDVQGLGIFLEIEARGEADWEGQKRKVISLLSQLGLGESIRKSYLELLEEQSKEKQSRESKEKEE